MPIQILVRHLDADAIRAFDASLACEPYEGEPYERLFLVSVKTAEEPARLDPPPPGQDYAPRHTKAWLAKHAQWQSDKLVTEKAGAKLLNRLAEADHAEGERIAAVARVKAAEAMALDEGAMT